MNHRFENFDSRSFGNTSHSSDSSDFGELSKVGSISDVAPGTLLVASPALGRSPFQRTVVFVMQNNQEGTFGVVLNRPADDHIKFAWQQLTGSESGDRFIMQGGPIGGPVFALHREAQLAELEMPGGIFVSAASEKFQQLVENDDSTYRIVFGVSGWKRGQLNDEIEEGLWFAIDGNADRVFDDPTWMWEKSIRKYGQQLLCDVIGVDGLPESPLSN
ncbi:MAG: YqgE/AlgH family protein [Mariniblastus sp.]